MNDTKTYFIQLNRQIEISEFNSNSPLEMKWLQAEPDGSSFVIHTDQSGLIGMLRHLHARGLVLLSVTSNPQPEIDVCSE